jgi:hypothetical protein
MGRLLSRLFFRWESTLVVILILRLRHHPDGNIRMMDAKLIERGSRAIQVILF